MDCKRPFSDSDWQAASEPVRKYVEALEQEIIELTAAAEQQKKRIDIFEKRLNKNSHNSSKPPSSDNPYRKPRSKDKKEKARKRGGQKGHKGHQQELLEGAEQVNFEPELCQCGCNCIVPESIKPYYTHQHIELPKIHMEVTHFVLHQGQCCQSGTKSVPIIGK